MDPPKKTAREMQQEMLDDFGDPVDGLLKFPLLIIRGWSDVIMEEVLEILDDPRSPRKG